MSVREFWDLTFIELNMVMQGYQKRMEHQRELAAWHAANIMSMWSKRPVRPKQLLGKQDESVSIHDFATPEAFMQYMAEREAELLNEGIE